MPAQRNDTLKAHFLSKELAQLSGLTDYMVSYLRREELLKPKVLTGENRLDAGPRFGKARMFSFSDVLLARSIRKLLSAGVSVKQLRKSIEVLEGKLGKARQDLTRLHVTIIGKQIYVEPSGSAPVELTHDGQMAFSYMLELDQLRTEAGKLVTNRTTADRKRVRRHSQRSASQRKKA